MQYFEWYLPSDGKFYQQVIKNAPMLHDIGITSVWLPPAFKGMGGIHDVGYGTYDLYDLGEFDQKGTVRTKYGTKDEYIQAIEALHQNDIDVYGDIVLNHKFGGDEYETVHAYEMNIYNMNQKQSQEESIEVATKYTFKNRNEKYSSFVWDWTCFDGIDYDKKTKRHARFLFESKDWDKDVDNENGNYDYLMGADIDFSNRRVLEELFHWGHWYLDKTHLDGFRLDAIKHINAQFYKYWIEGLRKNFQQELFTVGEYWHGNVMNLLNYLNEVDYKISLFDVPLHYRFYEISHSFGNYDMSQIFEGTLVKAAPVNAVTFVDNHDTQPSQGLQSWVDDWFKPLAYSLILLRQEGYPCIFYGDYYGIPTHQISAKKKMLDTLLFIRKNYMNGECHDYFDHQHIIGWTFSGGFACIMTDEKGGSKQMYIGKEYAGKYFVDALGNYKEEVKIDEQGYGIFYVEDGSVSVYIEK